MSNNNLILKCYLLLYNDIYYITLFYLRNTENNLEKIIYKFGKNALISNDS